MHFRLLLHGPVIVACILVSLTKADGAESDFDQLKAQLQAQIDAEVKAVKAQCEDRIEGLEKRINALESDNARLKSEAKATSPKSTRIQISVAPTPATAGPRLAFVRSIFSTTGLVSPSKPEWTGRKASRWGRMDICGRLLLLRKFH